MSTGNDSTRPTALTTSTAYMQVVDGSERWYCRVEGCMAFTEDNVPYGYCTDHQLEGVLRRIPEKPFPPIGTAPLGQQSACHPPDLTRQSCDHRDFAATVGVHRIEDRDAFVAEVSVHCLQCRLEFGFLGLPAAIAIDRPCVNINGTIASLPMKPGPQPLAMQMTVYVPAKALEQAEGLRATIQRFQDGTLLGKHGREQADMIHSLRETLARVQALQAKWRTTAEPGVLSEMGLRAERERASCADALDAALASDPTNTSPQD